MPRAGRPKIFPQRNLLSPDDVDLLFPEATSAGNETGRIVSFPVADLWFDDQPRQIVPDSVLTALIAGDRAQPHALLAALRDVATSHPYYKTVLDGIGDLARTIKAEGVLNPLLVVVVGDRHIVRDGHRRSLASLLAEADSVPIHVVDEPSAVQAAARQLVVNLQREDLTALEKGRWILRLALLVEQQRRTELALVDGPSVIEALVKRETEDSDEADDSRGASAAEREIAADVRHQVCELTGLSQRHYYNLIYLNRLTSEAREIGIGLAEGQLRPVTSLPPSEQAEIVAFIAHRNLSSKEATSLVQV
ncbi:MAG TPA: ParB N-terminal domain-containing protein, partial [Chloroflexota bacterium]|nr:ParB N-terminal domain-containing protein [Chloroflexota bacterium]